MDCCLTKCSLSLGAHSFHCFHGPPTSYPVDGPDMKYLKGRDRVGKFQRKATKMIQERKGLTYEER